MRSDCQPHNAPIENAVIYGATYPQNAVSNGLVEAASLEQNLSQPLGLLRSVVEVTILFLPQIQKNRLVNCVRVCIDVQPPELAHLTPPWHRRHAASVVCHDDAVYAPVVPGIAAVADGATEDCHG